MVTLNVFKTNMQTYLMPGNKTETIYYKCRIVNAITIENRSKASCNQPEISKRAGITLTLINMPVIYTTTDRTKQKSPRNS